VVDAIPAASATPVWLWPSRLTTILYVLSRPASPVFPRPVRR